MCTLLPPHHPVLTVGRSSELDPGCQRVVAVASNGATSLRAGGEMVFRNRWHGSRVGLAQALSVDADDSEPFDPTGMRAVSDVRCGANDTEDSLFCLLYAFSKYARHALEHVQALDRKR